MLRFLQLSKVTISSLGHVPPPFGLVSPFPQDKMLEEDKVIEKMREKRKAADQSIGIAPLAKK